MAIALGTQWVFNIIWSVATPYMISNIGWATFLIFAIVDACSAVFSWFFVRETMGKSLEQMETEFHSEAADLAAKTNRDNQNEAGVSSIHEATVKD